MVFHERAMVRTYKAEWRRRRTDVAVHVDSIRPSVVRFVGMYGSIIACFTHNCIDASRDSCNNDCNSKQTGDTQCKQI